MKRYYKIDAKALTRLYGSKTGMTPKYLRKWFYDKVILEGVLESVADFFEGRSPATVGSANYMERTRQADHFYQKVVEQLGEVLTNEWGKYHLL